ncbi:MAG: hypothetical protein M3016_01840 [Actinomycetota bacterium]|nr:hypothetical protein [Actinomycetota bacterium]
MSTGRFQRFLPITGILFAILLALGIGLTLDEPSKTDSIQRVFSYWHGHKGVELISSILLIHLSAVLLVFFGAGLRAALRSGEAEEASYSSVAYGGAILAAAGFSLVAVLAAAAANSADQGARATVYTINQLASWDWLAWTPGLTVMLIAAGLGGLRTLALPRALCYSALFLGVAFFTPAGPFALLLLPPWTLAASLVLYRGQRHPRVTPVAAGSAA